MSRNSKLISENLREEIAKELGVYDQVKADGGSWANVPSKTCVKIQAGVKFHLVTVVIW